MKLNPELDEARAFDGELHFLRVSPRVQQEVAR